MECTRKPRLVPLGGVTNMEVSTWSNCSKRREAGQPAAWLCAEEIV
jgi:hypothetical protein